MSFKKVALLAIKKASKILLQNFKKGNRGLKFKSRHEISTLVDKLAEKEILNIIRKYFPRHQILSEEKGLSGPKSQYLWIIDPLDGTTNYSMGNPLFGISIALAYQNEIILGVIYAPYLKEFYMAEKNRGAFLNQKRIKVSTKKNLDKSLLTFCHGHREKDIKKLIKLYQRFKLLGWDFRQLGSASLELCFVARGSTECIMIPGAHVWDVASGTLLVREAGGKVTDFQKNEWNLKSKDMLASNGKIHQSLLKIIRKIK